MNRAANGSGLGLTRTSDYLVSATQAGRIAANTSYTHLPAFCLKLLGFEVIINLKRYENKISIRELLLFKLWDIEVFGFTYVTKGDMALTYLSFLGCRITRTIEWSKSTNRKMAAIILMISLSCLLIYTESHQSLSTMLALMLSPMAALTFTELLVSYRFIVALIEVFSGCVNGIIGFQKQNLSWNEFLCYFAHYRIIFFLLALPPVFLESSPLLFLLLSSIAIEYMDAYFSNYGMLVMNWDYFNMSFVFLGYSNTNERDSSHIFKLLDINCPLANPPNNTFLSGYFRNIAHPKSLNTDWAENALLKHIAE